MNPPQMPPKLGSELERLRDELLKTIQENMNSEIAEAIEEASAFNLPAEEVPEFVIQTEGACCADQE
jgi:hypothetical protein